MGKLLLAFALVIVSFGQAAAQDAPKVKAHIECMSGSKALKKGKKQALPGDIACVITVDGGTVPDVSTSGMLTISQKGGAYVEPRWGSLALENGVAFVPFDQGFARMNDFMPCKDLTIEGAIGLYGSDIAASLWHGKFTVKAKCKKPKKMKATLACVTVKGNDVSCSVTGKKKAKAAEGVLTLTTEMGSRSADMSITAEMKPYGSVKLPADAYLKPCGNVIKATVTNANGQTVWTGKKDVGPTCPD